MKGILGILAFLAIGLVIAGGAVSAFGYGKGMGMSEDVEDALNSGDYKTWRNAMEDELTEDNFNEMRARHQEMNQHRENDQLFREAVEEGDYGAYVEAFNTVFPDGEVMSQTDFETLVEIHEARAEGDFELADSLMDDLDEGVFPGMGPGFGGPRGPGGMHGSMQGGFAGDCPNVE